MKSKELKTNLYSVLVILIMLFMISTLTYNLLPLRTTNRIIGFFIFAVVLLLVLRRMSVYRFCVLMFALALGITSCLVSDNLSMSITDMIYWELSILIFLMLSNKKDMKKLCDALEHERKLMLIAVILCDIIVFGGLFYSGCYSKNWSGSYFCGFAPNEHALCSGCCLLLASIFALIKNEQFCFKHIVLLSPGIYAILASGARVFLISLVCFVLIYYTFFLRNRSVKILIFPIVVFAGVYIFFRSGMYEKFVFVSGNENISSNAVGQITSGRTLFWAIDLKAFVDLKFIYKLLGKGFDYVYYINESQYGMKIWAHNDIINLLLSVGIIGTMLYVAVLWKAVRACIRTQKRRIVKWILFSYIVFPMLLNGLFTYQHYVYSIVLLVIFCSREDVENEKEKGSAGVIPVHVE